MSKRLLIFLMSALLALTLCGCWNYRSLDQMDIVVGVAIDFDKEANEFKISYEVADLLRADKKGSINGALIESRGKTLFDAARNAKRKEADKLFFGSAYIVVISQDIAREMGLMPVLEWFLRDGECRETMCVALSLLDTAKAVLERPKDASGILSVELHDIIMEDNKVTSSSMHTRIYEIYGLVKPPRRSVMLPALRKSQTGKQGSCEINGTGVFKEDKLVGFLTPEESKSALFVEDKLKSGILTLSMTGGQPEDMSLEIFGNTTKKSFTYEQGKVKISIETDTDVSVAENQSRLDIMDAQVIKSVEAAAAKKVEKNIADVIAKVQSEFKADIFGFGEMIYKQNLPLWRQLEPSWDELFPTLEVEVAAKVNVINTASIQ